MESINDATTDWDDVIYFVVDPGLSLKAICLNVECLDLLFMLFCQPFGGGLANMSLA